MKKWFAIVVFICFYNLIYAQLLKPGFNAEEYKDLLVLNFSYSDSALKSMQINHQQNYLKRYSSPEVGLKNKWELWVHKNFKIAVISIRGTVNDPVSWLANFYAATIPANGALTINDSTIFNYKFSDNPQAVVHTGWTISLAHLAPDIVKQINILYAEGYRDFIVTGHSQGGAIAFLTSSYLHYNTSIPKDIYFKTYCSAAPKPGNLFYAYDFEFINKGGWAYRVINSADWVPETPFSVQGLKDFNAVNPFSNIEPVLKKQKTLVRWYMGNAYHKMDKSTLKAAKKFQKYLGEDTYKMAKKTLPQLKKPTYSVSNNYSVAGNAVVLLADSVYHQRFTAEKKNVFQHHSFTSYYYLTERYYGNK